MSKKEFIPSVAIRVIFSLWLAILYSIRIAISDFIYFYPRGSFLNAITGCRTIFILLVSGFLSYASLSVGKKTLEKWKKEFWNIVKEELKNILSIKKFPFLVVIVLFTWFLFTGIPEGKHISYVVVRFKEIIKGQFTTFPYISLTLLSLIVIAIIVAGVVKLLKAGLRKYPGGEEDPGIRALEEWYIGFLFFLVLTGIFIWVGKFTFTRITHPETLNRALIGFFKDVFIYLFLSCGLVNAMLRYREVMPEMSRLGLQLSFTLFSSIAAFLFILLLTLDFNFITYGLASYTPEFPYEWQKIAIRKFRIINDFVLWAFLSITIFIMLIRQYFRSLTKMFFILAVRYSENSPYIELARVHKDIGNKETTSEIWTRNQIISKIEEGYTFVIRYKHQDKWKWGRDVHLVESNGKKYLRIDRNKIEEDNLGFLPEW